MKERNSGLDILKIVCMWMIVSIHALNHGKILEALQPFTAQYYITYSYYALTFVTNNVFVLISGYFLVNREFRLTKLLSLWIQVTFYTVAGFVFMMVYRCGFLGESLVATLKEGIPFLFPMSGGGYWFFSCYLMLYLMTPLLNAALHNMNKNHLLMLIVTMLVLFGLIYPFISLVKGDTFGIKNGQSLISFIFLYLIGAYINLYYKDKIEKQTVRFYILCGVMFLILLPISRFLLDNISYMLMGRQTAFPGMLYINTSLPVLLASILFLLAGIKYRDRHNWCTKISNLTSDVYLAHENYAWRGFLWNFIDYPSHWFGSLRGGEYFIVTVTSVFACGLLVGVVRSKLFSTTCIANKLTHWIVSVSGELGKE